MSFLDGDVSVDSKEVTANGFERSSSQSVGHHQVARTNRYLDSQRSSRIKSLAIYCNLIERTSHDRVSKATTCSHASPINLV